MCASDHRARRSNSQTQQNARQRRCMLSEIEIVKEVPKHAATLAFNLRNY